MIESTIKVGDWVQVTKTSYFGIKPLLLSHPRKVTAVLNDIIAVDVPGKNPIFPEGWWLNKRCGNDWHKVPAPKVGE